MRAISTGWRGFGVGCPLDGIGMVRPMKVNIDAARKENVKTWRATEDEQAISESRRYGKLLPA